MALHAFHRTHIGQVCKPAEAGHWAHCIHPCSWLMNSRRAFPPLHRRQSALGTEANACWANCKQLRFQQVESNISPPKSGGHLDVLRMTQKSRFSFSFSQQAIVSLHSAHIITHRGMHVQTHTLVHVCNPVHMPMHECIPTVNSGLTGIQGAHHFPARVYSCSEQFDVTLISNYASLGMGGKMSILLVPR